MWLSGGICERRHFSWEVSKWSGAERRFPGDLISAAIRSFPLCVKAVKWNSSSCQLSDPVFVHRSFFTCCIIQLSSSFVRSRSSVFLRLNYHKREFDLGLHNKRGFLRTTCWSWDSKVASYVLRPFCFASALLYGVWLGYKEALVVERLLTRRLWSLGKLTHYASSTQLCETNSNLFLAGTKTE